MIGIRLQENIQPEERCKVFESEMMRYIKYRHLFSNSEIITNIEQKAWLLTQLQPFINSPSLETKLLYKLDKLNQTNFHKYIDGKMNLLVVVKLANGLIVGGYSGSPIEKDTNNTSCNKGFLFSFENLTTYLPKADNQHPVATYDDYFLVIGNSEIRIRAHEKKIYSNFGANNGIFNTGGKKVKDFLGVPTAETELETYEIYYVISQ